MQIVAVTNIKGGVGKTTSCVNLAYLSAASGRRTALWDLDPQGAATYALRGELAETVSAKKLVTGKRVALDVAQSTGYERLDLVPADFSFRKFDVHLSRQNFPVERLLRMSHSLAREYHTLFLDCPAGISLLSENVLHAADVVLVPLQPTPLSMRMLVQLQDFLGATGWTDMRLLPFFSMVDRRKSLHRFVIDSSREAYPAILRTEVPYSSDIERMSVRRAPIPSYAPKSPATHVYTTLWSEIVTAVPSLGTPAPAVQS